MDTDQGMKEAKVGNVLPEKIKKNMHRKKIELGSFLMYQPSKYLCVS